MFIYISLKSTIEEVQIKLKHGLFHLAYCSIELPEDARKMVLDGYKNGNVPHQVRSTLELLLYIFFMLGLGSLDL